MVNMKKLRNLFPLFALILLVVLLDRPGYSEEEKPALIVFDFAVLEDGRDDQTSDSGDSGFPVGDVLGRIMAHNLDRALSSVKELTMIDRSHWTEVQRIATSQRIRPAGVEDLKGISDSLTASDLGKLVAADVAISGQVQVSSATATIIVQAIEMARGEVLGVEAINVREIREIPVKARELSRRFLPLILPVGEVLGVEMDQGGRRVEISFYDWVEAKPGDLYRTIRPGAQIKDPTSGRTLALEDRTDSGLSVSEIGQDSSIALSLSPPEEVDIRVGDQVWIFKEERGYLSLSSSPSRAQVFLNDRLTALTPLNILRLAPGDYNLLIVKEAFKDLFKEIEISEGELTSLEIDLDPNWGNLEVSSQPPGAEVYIDGRPRGLSPGLVDMVVVGSREVRLVAEGYEDWIGEVDIELGGTTELAAVLDIRRRGELVVESFPPGGDVYINEQLRGTSPLELEDMRIGSYRIRITKKYFDDWEGIADVAENKRDLVMTELVYSDPTLIDDFEDVAESIPNGKATWKVLKDKDTLTTFRKTFSLPTGDGSRGGGRWSYSFPGDNRPHLSGIEIVFGEERPEDWSEYESLSLEIRSEDQSGLFAGANEVSLRVLLHDPNVTLPTERDTWKIVTAKGFIKLEASWIKIAVPLNLFSIDEGWLDDYRRSFWDNFFGSDKKEASLSIDWSKIYGFGLTVEAESGRSTLFIDNLRLTRPATASRPATEG